MVNFLNSNHGNGLPKYQQQKTTDISITVSRKQAYNESFKSILTNNQANLHLIL